MLERYSYPKQSYSQVLKSVESCVACLGIQRKRWGNNFYFIFHYHNDVILLMFCKVSVTNTEIVAIWYQVNGTFFCTETMNFDVKVEQRSHINFGVEIGKTPVQTRYLLKQMDCWRTVSRALSLVKTIYRKMWKQRSDTAVSHH